MKSEPYITLKIKPKTAAEFRKFSRSLGRKQSEVLQLMLDFFNNNGISPLEELGPNLFSLEKRIKLRINAVVAILRDIEKTQIKPTHAMLQLLFQESSTKKKELVLEKQSPPTSLEDSNQMELLKVQRQVMKTREELHKKGRILNFLIEKVVVTRNSFGQPYLRLNMSKADFEKLKLDLKTV